MRSSVRVRENRCLPSAWRKMAEKIACDTAPLRRLRNANAQTCSLAGWPRKVRVSARQAAQGDVDRRRQMMGAARSRRPMIRTLRLRLRPVDFPHLHLEAPTPRARITLDYAQQVVRVACFTTAFTRTKSDHKIPVGRNSMRRTQTAKSKASGGSWSGSGTGCGCGRAPLWRWTTSKDRLELGQRSLYTYSNS